MLKVKKATYGPIPKNNEPTKLTTKTKQKNRRRKKQKQKQNNQWLCKINSIDKKEYHK